MTQELRNCQWPRQQVSSHQSLPLKPSSSLLLFASPLSYLLLFEGHLSLHTWAHAWTHAPSQPYCCMISAFQHASPLWVYTLCLFDTIPARQRRQFVPGTTGCCRGVKQAGQLNHEAHVPSLQQMLWLGRHSRADLLNFLIKMLPLASFFLFINSLEALMKLQHSAVSQWACLAVMSLKN